jgi:saccharopine dehydrogenase-like NADP-dependent oxidoreductase
MRVIILGGSGNFGARIVRALHRDPPIELLVAGRTACPLTGADDVSAVILDIASPDFAERLKALSPGLVIHCVGPFQGQDYRVATASVAAGAHYLDLADGRDFVVDFAKQLNPQAIAAGRVAISGASTLPALSSAVLETLREELSIVESIEVVIAPGQLAPRGAATLAAAFSYLGRPIRIWCDGRWHRAWGWMGLRSFRLDIGSRLGAVCDVPDLALFPRLYPGVQHVSFHAALEFRAQHLALWCLAALRRVGLPLPVSRWAVALNRWAGLFDWAAGDKGGMCVSTVGVRADGARVRRTWQLTTKAEEGPEIPIMPAILLTRRLAQGDVIRPGAYPCMGFLTLRDFAPEFARRGITTRVEETAA